MSVWDIYNKIHQCIVDYWTMFIGSPVDDFTTILWNLVVYGTQFLLDLLYFMVHGEF
ncbi:hypothetical protein [Spiroplasma endosymbiont of Andrena trimmerana]|uniref:hypothetical protein n=1 Tax=Spiroplasma endosymbiont of Andrena trimmerana TaxID=3066316 RepID=UPI0030CB0EC5